MKPVFAVPGPITSKQSDGTAYLLKNGATLISAATDILKEYGLSKKSSNHSMQDLSTLSEEERKIVKLLEHEPQSLDDLAKTIKLPPSRLAVIVTGLEMKGIIQKRGDGMFGIS